MNDVDDLIKYLDTGLYRLRELLHHLHELSDRIYRERRALSIEEETE